MVSRKFNFKYVLIILMLSVTYFTTYLTRKSYAISLPEIITTTGLTKDILSIPVTVLFITYGVFQIVAGIICDRTKFRFFVPISLAVSGIINIIVTLNLSNPVLVSVLWGINGISQAFMWPSLVKMCSDVSRTKNEYSSIITGVTIGGYAGQCLLYVVAWLFVRNLNFKYTFYFAAGFSFIIAIIFTIFTLKFKKEEDSVEQENSVIQKNISTATSYFSLMFVLLLIVIALVGALRDSLETWTPTFIVEAFSIQSDNAIISSLVLPVLGVVFIEVTLIIYKKLCKNPMKLTLIFCGLCFISLLVLLLFGKYSSILTLILLALGYGLSCAINHCIISYIPIYYKDTGKVSTIASVLNAFTYVGSASATYIIGYVSRDDVLGWNGAMVTWVIIISLVVLISVVILIQWNRKFPIQSTNEE